MNEDKIERIHKKENYMIMNKNKMFFSENI